MYGREKERTRKNELTLKQKCPALMLEMLPEIVAQTIPPKVT